MKVFMLTVITFIFLTGCFADKKSVQPQTTLPSETEVTSPPSETGVTSPNVKSTQSSMPNKSPQLPKLINHPRPNLQVNLAAFLKASGCQTGDALEMVGCENLRAKMGCDKLIQPDPLWGGLAPAYPMALCLIVPNARQYPKSPKDAKKLALEIIKGIEKEGYFTREPGKETRYTRYVILQDGQFKLIKNIEELQQVFAPIESSLEALSYALMVTQLKAYYGQKLNPTYRYYADVIEDTHVVDTKEGYNMLLYSHKTFGCSSHPVSTTSVTVKTNGMISYPSQRLAYANPAEDNLCFD
jgi:hypothetical protein